jgi:hypothetical protein
LLDTLVGGMLCSWIDYMWRFQQHILHDVTRDSSKNTYLYNWNKTTGNVWNICKFNNISFSQNFRLILQLTLSYHLCRTSPKALFFIRVLFLITVRSKNEAHNQYGQNIIFQHSILLMLVYHLYRFISPLNAVLLTITRLLKNTC